MRFRFIDAEKALYPVRLLCRCLAVSRSGYYAWRKRPPSARGKQDARLRVEISASHSASRRTYGAPASCATFARTVTASPASVWLG